MKYFKEDSISFLDGSWIKASDAKGSLYNQTMHYGYGVFDGLRSYKNADGCNIFRAKKHFQRLIDSAKKLHIQLDFTAEELVNVTYKLLDKNNLQTAYIRPLIFLEPNMDLTVQSKSHIFIGAWPWKKYLGHDPINVMISQYQKPSVKQQPVNAKIVGRYTTSILASSQAKKLGYDEALLLDSEGFIAEGPAANFFIETDNILFTPNTDYAFPGITRQTIIESAREWGIEVVEKNVSLRGPFILLFKGVDAQGRQVELILNDPSRVASDKDVPSTPGDVSLRLSYIQNPLQPDVYKINPENF